MRASGIDVRLISPRRWNEGGSVVAFEAGADSFVSTSRTVGHHPYLFVYNPLPIWRLLRSGPVDVLDIHEEPASLAAAEVLALRLLARCRAPVMFYGAENLEKRYLIPFRWIERWALRTAAGVQCCNDDALAIFQRKGFRGRSKVMGLGVDVDRFSVPAAGCATEGRFRVGFVGRLERRKGIGVVIDAIAGLPDVEFYVYGSGPDRAAFEDQARRLGLGDRVVFHGFVGYDDLPGAYRSMDSFVFPSQTTATWVEQFGRVAVEAMAAGVPVIGSSSGSIRDVVGDAGIIVPEADVNGWRAAIASLANDEPLRRRLAEAGRERVQRYSWAAIAHTHALLYRELAGA